MGGGLPSWPRFRYRIDEFWGLGVPVGRGAPLTALNALPLSLAKYDILGEIGHGGMATVYRARDRRLGRDVALKVIHRHLRENEEVGRRFQAEALAVAKVKHPNIVEVYDVSGDDDDERYLVTELIEGITLRELLTRHAPLPAEIAACIAREVARALAQAHRHGVVHRDVKPENVLLALSPQAESDKRDSSGELAEARVKLTDFGIAKLLDAQGVTSTGQVLGSPAHMAPEQIEGGDVDARSDVFGVGVLLYEMLTGNLPFEGKNPAQVLRRVLEGTFVQAERARAQVGARYSAIAGRALAHQPADRYQTATQLAEALEAELASLGATDIRAEVARFLDSPTSYLQEHDERIPERLVERAQRERKSGDVLRSASDFNRALAYRPDDTILLAEVAGLARRARTRRRLKRGIWLLGMGGILASAAGLGALVWLRVLRTTPRPAAPAAVAQPAPARVAPSPVTAAAPNVVEANPSNPATVRPRPSTGRPTPAKPVVEPPTGTRAVRTPVVGPQNARVRIDGQVRSWFAVHDLSYGSHTFEFVPPNAECCEVPSPQVIEIIPGDGPQIVRGTIAFRPAVLTLDAAYGARASCGIAGVIEAHGSRTIPMTQPERQVTCTLFPPPGTAGEPKRIDVTLRPGRTFTLGGSQ
ncbi:MAG TPA: protein kinase [Polyangiaceae bacterium]|nr:protein kinase [Polyangiaceae bacterium]